MTDALLDKCASSFVPAPALYDVIERERESFSERAWMLLFLMAARTEGDRRD